MLRIDRGLPYLPKPRKVDNGGSWDGCLGYMRDVDQPICGDESKCEVPGSTGEGRSNLVGCRDLCLHSSEPTWGDKGERGTMTCWKGHGSNAPEGTFAMIQLENVDAADAAIADEKA